MVNSTTLPDDAWKIIVNQCVDLKSLVLLSRLSKITSKIAFLVLKDIKINQNVIYQKLNNIQDIYTLKYQTINGPNFNITTLGRHILLQLKTQDNIVSDNKTLIIIFNEIQRLKNNQAMITPTFGKAEFGVYLPENNPHYPTFGLGLDSMAYSIAQDRLPIKEITIKSGIQNPHLSIAIDIAKDRINKQLFQLNGSYVELFLKKLTSKSNNFDVF